MKHVIYGEDGKVIEERDLPDALTQPALLTKLGFVELCQSAGGMTDAMLVAARNDPNFAALWIKLDLATDVNKGHAATLAGLNGLKAAGYLTKSVKTVLDNWPEV